MKAYKVKLSRNTTALFVLSRDCGEYTITVIEERASGESLGVFCAPKISPSKQKAKKIFKKICRGHVFGETILDVVYNLME